VIIGANFLFVISNILVEGTEIVELSYGFFGELFADISGVAEGI